MHEPLQFDFVEVSGTNQYRVCPLLLVSTVVLRALEQNQSNTELRLAARQSVQAIAQGTDGFAAAYLSLRTGATGELTPPSAREIATYRELRDGPSP